MTPISWLCPSSFCFSHATRPIAFIALALGVTLIKLASPSDRQIEAIKGGLSGAMKRGVVQWGVGRYLYDIETMWGICKTKEQYQALQYSEKQEYTYAKLKDNSPFYWKPPVLGDKYLPQTYVIPSIAKNILELAEKTETDMKDILDSYGVASVRDLFKDEAGDVTDILLRRQKRQLEQQENQ